MIVVVTGANGFVGSLLSGQLVAEGHHVRAIVWSKDSSGSLPEGVDILTIDSIETPTDWQGILQGADVVVHLAAKVHDVPVIRNGDAIDEYRRVNTRATEIWAGKAADWGVKRFIFMSTIKVNGERTQGKPFNELDDPAPQDAYGVSKWEAEKAIEQIALARGIEYVIIRPPLLYGPGVRANFLRLLKIIRKGIPLPFGRISNKRSLLYVGNLVDVVKLCVNDDRARCEKFVVCDDTSVSTSELIELIAQEMHTKAKLFPFSTRLLRLSGKLVGEMQAIDKMIDSLEVNDNKIRFQLQWSPPFTMQEGIRETVRWFISYEKSL